MVGRRSPCPLAAKRFSSIGFRFEGNKRLAAFGLDTIMEDFWKVFVGGNRERRSPPPYGQFLEGGGAFHGLARALKKTCGVLRAQPRCVQAPIYFSHPAPPFTTTTSLPYRGGARHYVEKLLSRVRRELPTSLPCALFCNTRIGVTLVTRSPGLEIIDFFLFGFLNDNMKIFFETCLLRISAASRCKA